MDTPVVCKLPVEDSTNPTPWEESLGDLSASILEALLSIVSTVFGSSSWEDGITYLVHKLPMVLRISSCMCKAARNQYCSPRQLTRLLVELHQSWLSLASYLWAANLGSLWFSPHPYHFSVLYGLSLPSLYVFPQCLNHHLSGPFSAGVCIFLLSFFEGIQKLSQVPSSSDYWTLINVGLALWCSAAGILGYGPDQLTCSSLERLYIL